MMRVVRWMPLLLALMACGPRVGSEDAGADSDTGHVNGSGTSHGESLPSPAPGNSKPNPPPNPTGGGPDLPTSTTADEPNPTTGEPGPRFDCGAVGDDGVSFIIPPDCGSDWCGGDDCDVWDQDCVLGEKCLAWANDGGPWWNGNRCSPIDPAPGQLGDACTVEQGPTSGIDSCDLGLMCFEVDDQTLEGRCVAQCTGTPDDPVCADGTACEIAFEGVFALCLPTCDPAAPSCQDGDVCVPVQGGDLSVCMRPQHVPPVRSKSSCL